MSILFRLNIYAVVIANAFFAFLVCILNSIALQKAVGYKQEFQKTFVIPAIASAIMGIITYFIYSVLFKFTNSNILSIAVAIIFAVVIYAVTLLLFKGLTEDEILKFPKGYLLVRLAKKCHLLR